MPTEADVIHKRQLVEAWLSAHANLAAPIAQRGVPLDRRTALARIASLAGPQHDTNYVYVLVERRPGEDIPAYIGKSVDPLKRWSSHLTALVKAKGSYARWHTRLLFGGQPSARFDLALYVIGQASVQFPPLPNFPITIGAVEYQLIGLAADAYPLPLLNHEGRGR